MKLDAETLRKLALAGARSEKRELETKLNAINEYIRQLSGASVSAADKKSVADKMKPKAEKRRKRRTHTEAFKAKVVKDALAANNASASAKKHDVSPNLVRMWIEKAAK